MFQSIIQNQLAKIGLKLGRLTPRENVLGLIKSLHPYKTQFDLKRMGPNSDGGYLLPNDLEGITACFSPGVSDISGFERDCLNHGMKIFMADNSVDKPNWDIPHSEFNFLKKFIGATDDDKFITMDNWVQSSDLPNETELLLQMDIEGSEYISIINMSDKLMRRIRILLIEFHHLDFIWQPYLFDFAEAVFKKILQTHICVHIHPNNSSDVSSLLGIDIPRALEFTFLRIDRVNQKEFQTQFPHPFDFDNVNANHISLPAIWYRSL